MTARPRRVGAQPTYASATGTSFEMIAPPGPFTLEVDAPDGWAVKSLTLGGFDAADLAIDIGGEQGVPVTVVLTDRITDVSGTVAGADGDGAYVVVFPADSGNWTRRRVRSAQTDARGRFRIVGLPPGERYLAVAVRDLDEGQEADPEFLQQVQTAASVFNLRHRREEVAGFEGARAMRMLMGVMTALLLLAAEGRCWSGRCRRQPASPGAAPHRPADRLDQRPHLHRGHRRAASPRRGPRDQRPRSHPDDHDRRPGALRRA